jgi:hypothetical protein
MTPTPPDWLVKHAGTLQPAAGGMGCMVYFAGEPQYFVLPLPAKGRFTKQVTQTVNGKRLESGTIYATEEEAVRGGLEDLRGVLGW